MQLTNRRNRPAPLRPVDVRGALLAAGIRDESIDVRQSSAGRHAVTVGVHLADDGAAAAVADAVTQALQAAGHRVDRNPHSVRMVHVSADASTPTGCPAPVAGPARPASVETIADALALVRGELAAHRAQLAEIADALTAHDPASPEALAAGKAAHALAALEQPAGPQPDPDAADAYRLQSTHTCDHGRLLWQSCRPCGVAEYVPPGKGPVRAW